MKKTFSFYEAAENVCVLKTFYILQNSSRIIVTNKIMTYLYFKYYTLTPFYEKKSNVKTDCKRA